MWPVRVLTKPIVGLAALTLGGSALLVGSAGIEPAGAQTDPGPETTAPTTTKFEYTRRAEVFTVPADVTTLTIVAAGGRGGEAYDGKADRGAGVQVSATQVSVQPGQALQVIVGGDGEKGGHKASPKGDGGFNGGGNAHATAGGGGGGGFSHVRDAATGTWVVIAAGGGGAGNGGISSGGRGAPYLGALNGENGTSGLSTAHGGGGGTLNAGGSGGSTSNPFVPDGKGGYAFHGGEAGPGVIPGKGGGGGGGGGYFGGGGAAGGEAGGGGGGAGASYVAPNVQLVATESTGAPQVSITYSHPDPKPVEPTLSCTGRVHVKVGETLTDSHICTAEGYPLPDVSIASGAFPSGVTFKRWPTPNDTWIVLNGTPTTAGDFRVTFEARSPGFTRRSTTGVDVQPSSAPPSSTPDPTSETTPDTTPDAAPDTTPDTTPDAAPDTTPDTTPDAAPDTTPDDQATARCDVTVQNLTGGGDPVELTNADQGGGDRWDPAPDDAAEIPDNGSLHWASFDPPPGNCHTEARLTLNRDGDPDVVWTISVSLGKGQAEATCDSSDDDYPCVVTPGSEIAADGVLTAQIELRHG